MESRADERPSYAHLVKMRVYNIDGLVQKPRDYGEPSEVTQRIANAFFSLRPISASNRPKSTTTTAKTVSRPVSRWSRSSSRVSANLHDDDDEVRDRLGGRSANGWVTTDKFALGAAEDTEFGETDERRSSLGGRCRRMLSAQIRRKVNEGCAPRGSGTVDVDVDRLIDTLLFRPITSCGAASSPSKSIPLTKPRAKTASATITRRRYDVDQLLLERSHLASRVHTLEAELGVSIISSRPTEIDRDSERDEEDALDTARAPETVDENEAEAEAEAEFEAEANIVVDQPTKAEAEVTNEADAESVKVSVPTKPAEKAKEDVYDKLKDDSLLGMGTLDCEEDCEPWQKPAVSKRKTKVEVVTVDEEHVQPVVQEHVQRKQYGLAIAVADIARKVIDNENMGITTMQDDDEPDSPEKHLASPAPEIGLAKVMERVKDTKELQQEVQQIRKRRRLFTPVEKLRASVKLIKYLIQATTTSKQLESKKEAKLLTFAELQQAITEDIQDDETEERIFNPNIYKACKEVRLGEEAKDILSIHPNSRSERDQQIALIALNQSVQAFSEFPLKMQQKLVQVGWYEKFGPKRVIIRQAHIALKFYFILSGSAVVSVSRHNKKTGESYTETVAILKKGNTFGELALMYGGRRSATITSIEELELLSLSRDDFVDIFMNLKADSEPEHIFFLRSVPSLRFFPIEELPYDDPKICLFMYFRRNSVLCRDSNTSEWVYILKSGTCRVLKDLKVPEHFLDQEIGVNLLTGNMTNPEREHQNNLIKFAAPPNMFPPARYMEPKPTHSAKKKKNKKPAEDVGSSRPVASTSATASASAGASASPSRPSTHRTSVRPQSSARKPGQEKKVYVQIQKLESRDVFTLLPIAFDFMGDSTSVMLVSDGAECVLINKAFFKKHCNETYLGWLRHNLQPYPRESVMQLNLDDYTWWRFYKQQLVENVKFHQELMSEYMLNA